MAAEHGIDKRRLIDMYHKLISESAKEIADVENEISNIVAHKSAIVTTGKSLEGASA